ncbi:hypothetical protein R1flu_011505 [Riccia fluitans]|uniref:Uncharacterized protein n=1 Tax=Riccia fluitans TaxID=41844 RepID=A0ABD1Z7Z6_9MARC
MEADEAAGQRRTRDSDRLERDEADKAAGRRRMRISDCLLRDEVDEAGGRTRMRLNSLRTRLNGPLNFLFPILFNPRDNWCRVFEEVFAGF